jgi:hypothetical protein
MLAKQVELGRHRLIRRGSGRRRRRQSGWIHLDPSSLQENNIRWSILSYMAGGFTFSCTSCGQTFEWTPQLAGRKLGCACGSRLVVPEMTITPVPLSEDEPPPSELIALKGDPPAGTLALDAAGREVHPVEALPQRVLAYQNPKDDRLGYLRDPLRSRRRDKIVPIVALSACAIVLSALCVLGSSPPGAVLRQILLRLGWDIAVTFAVFFFLVVYFIDPLIEKPALAALKLVTAATVRFTLWAMLALHSQQVVVDGAGFLVSFFPFALLLAYFFELDFTDTCFAILAITLVRWISYFGMWRLL